MNQLFTGMVRRREVMIFQIESIDSNIMSILPYQVLYVAPYIRTKMYD